MVINILLILVISNKPERVFLGERRTVSWERVQIGAENLKRVKYLKYWKRSSILDENLEIVS